MHDEGVKCHGPLSAESANICFSRCMHHLNKVIAVHFESRVIPYNVITNNSLLEWRRKMAGAHPGLQFSVDEMVLIVEIQIVFWKQTDVF